MTGRTFHKYWPWWIVITWLILYEIYAIVTPDTATLSVMVWHAQAAWPGLIYVVTGIIVVLWLHFFVRR